MWRSFFYAVGIGLFLMGGQALVTDHVVVPKDTRLQKLITKVLTDGEPKPANGGNVQAPYQSQFGAYPNSVAAQGGNYPYNSGSRFGPSRFSGPSYGDYRGGQGNFGQQARNSRQNIGKNQFGNGGAPTSAQLAAYRGAPSTQNVKPQVPMQKFSIREWMPWSLLAAGAIIFLYTHSLNGRHTAD